MALRNISSMGSKQDRPLIPLLQFSVTELEDGQTVDGLSLYRALSRQHTGDPNNYLDTMNAVLDHYLRVWVNQIHPSHEAVRVYEDNVFEQVDTFFNALACPDAVLLKEWPDVMEYIADVLNIQLHVWRRGPDEPEGESSYRHVSSYGKASLPVYHVQQSQHRGVQGSDGLSLTMTHFDSLVQDESGKQLITFLRAKKRDMDLERRYDAVPRLYNGLEMKQICWWWQTAANTDDFDNRQDGAYDERTREGLTLRCYNEYEANAPVAPRLDDFLDSLCVYTVSVTQPSEIQPALRLLTEALERAPAQEIPVIHKLDAGRKRPLCRYVGIDAEFAYRTATIDYSNTEGSEEELRNGEREHLCSVLTIAVDRHLVFSFYVLHMLENPTEETVSKLSELFDMVLFRREYLKVWWNYGEDFKVLDATIAHMFQGTPRERFLDHPYDKPAQWIQPTFKISSDHYGGERPRNLTFNKDQVDCPFHLPDGNDLDMTCPCRLGNVDLSTILDHICRELNLQTGIDHNSQSDSGEREKRWFVAKKFNSYRALLDNLLGKDRLYPLLYHLKEAPRFSGDVGGFYESLGPGMEVDSNKMEYNIGDVVGIALIMRFLTTTDDRKLLAGRLLNYAFLDNNPSLATHARYEAPPSIPQRLRPDQIPTETPLIVPVIEDNPRMWHRDQFGVECLTGTFPIRSEPITQHFNNRKINTAWDFYVRHEEVVRVGREKWTRVRNSSRVEHHEAAFRAAYQDLFDPTKFSLPEDIFTSALPQSHVDLSSLKAVVRTGKSHSEDLLDFVRSARSRRTRPPRGFLIQPGQIGSLPRWFDRRPGDSLEESEGILGAFSDRRDQLNQVQRRPPGTTHSFGQQRPLRGTWGDIDVTVRRGHWNYEHEQQELRAALEADLQREVTDGPLSEYQEENLFDTEGRQHNRNITSQGVENWQVYSQYDIANPRSEGRTPFRMLSRLRNLLNDNKWNFSEPAVAQTGTAQPNPGAQAPAPAQGGGDGPTTAQPSGAGAAPAANTQGANQGQGNNGNGEMAPV